MSTVQLYINLRSIQWLCARQHVQLLELKATKVVWWTVSRPKLRLLVFIAGRFQPRLTAVKAVSSSEGRQLNNFTGPRLSACVQRDSRNARGDGDCPRPGSSLKHPHFLSRSCTAGTQLLLCTALSYTTGTGTYIKIYDFRRTADNREDKSEPFILNPYYYPLLTCANSPDSVKDENNNSCEHR